jgi:hypothetical protein
MCFIIQKMVIDHTISEKLSILAVNKLRVARYNGGYVHLIAGMLRSGFLLYIASLGKNNFISAESYEQELISLWNHVRPQKRKKDLRQIVITEKPWLSKGSR